jgi:hopanoid C-3 methylase
MKLLLVHPGPLMYTRIFLRLEPLGLEIVGETARRGGHDVRLIDLQIETHAAYHSLCAAYQPDAIAFSCNYLANIPEIIDLAKATKLVLPGTAIIVGGHSASFVASEMLMHGEGAIDCVLKGEGEAAINQLLAAIDDDRASLHQVPGAVTLMGEGPRPGFVKSLEDSRPARDLTRHRHKYFIGHLDPCASIEFSRGCPWDCNFCSAWTFYGRSYRVVAPEIAAEELSRIAEPGIFIVDDVAFIQERHGLAIGEEVARRGIAKEYYLETRGDVLLRNKEVFRLWRDLGLRYMFLGIEAIDEEGLKKFRKRTSPGQNFEALEFARSLGIRVAINIIADCDWDEARFETVRQWCLEVPEIVNVSVNTPYPGTEIWSERSGDVVSRDYRLYDIQHAVLPTRLPLERFYAELVKTQQVMNRKHLGFAGLRDASVIALRLALRGQTNFIKMLWKFNSIYDPKLLLADHARDARYRIAAPAKGTRSTGADLYVHTPREKRNRAVDAATERFVAETR